jgi:plasmid replication initiation protein
MDNLEKNEPSAVLWQSNFITSSRYEMSATEKNIIYMVMNQIKKNDPPGTIYKISAVELMTLTNTELKYEALKKASAKLITRLLEGMEQNGNWLQTSFVASAEYITGKGIIEIELSSKLQPHFVELKEQFTTFQLDMALSLGSVYSKRLYEMLSQYKNMKDKTFKVDFIELKKRFNLIDPKTGHDKYEKYSQFKRAVLDVGLDEINGGTDIYFSYKAIEGKKYGRGRKPVTDIEFSVIYKGKEDAFSFDENNKPLFDRLTNDFKLRKDQANLVLQKHSREEINRELYQINIKMANKEIRDVGAFTAKVFGVQ